METTDNNEPKLKQLLDEIAAGRWVYGFDAGISRLLRHTASVCARYNGLSPECVAERDALIRSLLGKVGRNFTLNSPFMCDFGFNIEVGHDVVANFGLTVLDEAKVTIGNRVLIGPGTSIYTISHALLPGQRAAGVMKAAPVTIADDVWIGGNVTILPGVTIGEGAVIGAGSVVTRSVPPMSLAAGVPCKVIREITTDDTVDINPLKS